VGGGAPTVIWPRRTIIALLGASFLLSSAAVLINAGPTGDLAHFHTDHLRMGQASWVFLQRGPLLHVRGLEEASRGIGFRHAVATWGQEPLDAPPGAIALFLPLTVVGQLLPISTTTFGKMLILFLLIIAHLALGAVILALEGLPMGGRTILILVAWMILVRMAMQGFFGVALIGCAAVMVYFLTQGKWLIALRWFGVAALLSFRAWALIPLALAALWEVILERKGKGIALWPWRDLGAVAAAVLVGFGSWALGPPATAFLAAQPPALIYRPDSVQLWLAVALSGAAGALALRWTDIAVAGSVLAGLTMAVTGGYLWQHGAILLVAPLGVGAFRPTKTPSLARAVLLAWVLALGAVGFGLSPGDLFTDLARQLRLTP
jgi:hypothetical protein